MKIISRSLIALILLSFTASADTAPLVNQLESHPSPYLALHSKDPVHWQDWNKDVVARAKKENKLIFISSGYFSCHWCHVMQRESFSDKGVADALHRLTIPVKIDRELQPALDAWLIEFIKASTGHAGWPLNVFLTPDGYPLVGFTYKPKDVFIELLEDIQQRWNNERDYLKDLAKNAFELKPAVQTHAGFDGDSKTAKRLSRLLLSHALQMGDDMEGGFGEQRKFPMAPQLLALLEYLQQHPDQQLSELLSLTLDQMANRGLHDHINGGFYRYVIDRNWQTPHFEKMLYDNAQLALVYLRAASIFNKTEYQSIAESTLDFVLTQMKHTDNGYIASLSAIDDNNIEGGFYLWTKEQLTALLNKKEFTIAKLVWGLHNEPILDAGHHLKMMTSIASAAKQLSLPESEIKQILNNAKNKLRQARLKRKLPADNKVLAAWNGLLLTSLSEAAAVSEKKHYRKAAQELYQHLATRMWDGKQLYRFIHKEKHGAQVSLEDYAYVSDGILAWAKLSDDKKAWEISSKIALSGLKLFNNKNGWKLSEQIFIPYDARELVLSDSTMPSPSATLLKTLLMVARYNEDDKLKEEILKLADSDFEKLESSPFWYASHISLLSSMSDENKKR